MDSKPLLFVFFGLLLVTPILSFITTEALSSDSTEVTASVAKTIFASVNYANVTVLEAKTMIDSNPSLIILDVRNQSEYLDGHIRNAKLIPVWELTGRLDELNVSDEILVYCKAGFRSATASQILLTNGFLHVYNMLGGMTDWAREYPVYIKYASIQEAINNASDGDTVYVSTGLYTEHLSINKSLTLVGEDKYTTIIDGTNSGTVFYANADNVSISCFTMQNSGCSCEGNSGVSIGINHENINVTDNIMLSDGYGIRLINARRVIVAHNNISFASDSCLIRDSSEVLVLENNITHNFKGIEIDNLTESAFFGNTIFDSVTGISVSNSYNNTFFDNTLSSNMFYGFYISQSENNSIVHNSFLKNDVQVSVHNSHCLWDNGFEGNFWSDYTGSDGNLDGIGDTMLVIDSENSDNFPLMGTFQSFGTSLNYDVDIMSNSTINGFEYLEADHTLKLQVSSATSDQTYGFCRISIPHSLMDPNNGSISVVIDNGQTPVLFLNNTLYDNGTQRWIYFAYSYSAREILLVSEFPLFFFLLLLVVATVMAAAVCRRKRIPTCQRAKRALS